MATFGLSRLVISPVRTHQLPRGRPRGVHRSGVGDPSSSSRGPVGVTRPVTDAGPPAGVAVANRAGRPTRLPHRPVAAALVSRGPSCGGGCRWRSPKASRAVSGRPHHATRRGPRLPAGHRSSSPARGRRRWRVEWSGTGRDRCGCPSAALGVRRRAPCLPSRGESVSGVGADWSENPRRVGCGPGALTGGRGRRSSGARSSTARRRGGRGPRRPGGARGVRVVPRGTWGRCVRACPRTGR